MPHLKDPNNASRVQHPHTKFLLGSFACTLLIISIACVAIYSSFQRIALRSLARQDFEFSRQTDALADTMEQMVQQYGMQIFYDPAVTHLRENINIDKLEQIYDLRTLNTFVSSSHFLDSILIYNPRSKMIYSTDSRLLSTSIEHFSDNSAAELFNNVNSSLRCRPIHRVSFPGDKNEARYFSFLFFETSRDDEPCGSILMLNVDARWFMDTLLSFDHENSCILLDKQGNLLFSASSELTERLPLFLPQILNDQDSESNCIIAKDNGLRLICLYSKIGADNWYCLQIDPMDRRLPGLLCLRNTLTAILVFAFGVLGLVSCTAFIRYYSPIKQIRSALGKSKWNVDPRNQIQQLVQESSEYQEAKLLRSLLENKLEISDNLAPPPYALMLLEEGDSASIHLQIQKCPLDAWIDHQRGCDVILLSYKSLQDIHDLAGTLMEQTGCRVYLSLPRNSLKEIPNCYKILLEMKQQKFWYKGQRLLLEKDFYFSKNLSQIEKEQPQAILSALKNRNLEEARMIWNQLLESLKGCPFVEQVLIFHHLSHLLENEMPYKFSLLDDDALAQLQDISVLTNCFDNAFQLVVDHYQELREEKLNGISQQVMGFIQENFSDCNLSPALIATHMDMNTAYLGRLFKENTDFSISQYLNQTRITQAKALLLTTNQPIEAIAHMVGFSNTKYFYVVFKNITSMTPLQFRKMQE